MKRYIWLLGLPVIALCTLLHVTLDLGESGKLTNPWVKEHVYGPSRVITGLFNSVKFSLRGSPPPKQKIFILAVDEPSIQALGRFPWDRDIYAEVIHSAFSLGARAIGLDMALPEAQHRVPQEAYDLLAQLKAPDAAVAQLRAIEPDPELAKTIAHYADRLVLGHTFEGFCQPGIEATCLTDRSLSPKDLAYLERFSIPGATALNPAQQKTTPLLTPLSLQGNIDSFANAALVAGHFSALPDPDGVIRRYPLIVQNDGHLLPSLALALATVVRGESVRFDISEEGKVSGAFFTKTNQNIPITPSGFVDFNFREKQRLPDRGFIEISALDVVRAALDPDAEASRVLRAKMDGAVLIFAATAQGLTDLRPFPVHGLTPGVVGHMTILDNLLSDDLMTPPSSLKIAHWTWLGLILFGVLFSLLFSRLSAQFSLLSFLGFIGILGTVDIYFLFDHGIQITTVFLLIELTLLFALLVSARFILEERDKEFVRSAFSRYLAPSVVNMVLESPEKLTVGGERKELSVLFSDLRGFTSMSENMNPKQLSQFLNEYLSEMTDQVFLENGTLDKYIGDAVMAFWGAPLPIEKHASAAMNCAIRMIRRLHELQPKFQKTYGVEPKMGVGVHSGEVSVGNMGSSKIFEYTVIGDNVNLASRLEGVTKSYGAEIVVSKTTYDRALQEGLTGVTVRPLDLIKVVGKKQAVEIIEVFPNSFPAEALKTFAAARGLYLERKFSDAASIFMLTNNTVERETGDQDMASLSYIERCTVLEHSPPPEDWDGSFERRTK
jgi:adenylate cyclase